MVNIQTSRPYESDGLLTAVADYGSIQTNTVLVSSAPNRHIEIHSISISSSTTTGVTTLNEETSGDLIWKFYHSAQARSGIAMAHIDLAEDKDLLISCPANTTINVTYHLGFK